MTAKLCECQLLSNSRSARPILVMIAELIDDDESIDAATRAELAYDYRRDCMLQAFAENRHEDAFNFILVGAEGLRAFEGPDRLCRGNFNEPDKLIELTCSAYGTLKLVRELYGVMRDYDVLPPFPQQRSLAVAWGEGFVPGSRIASLIRNIDGVNPVLCELVANMALSLADYARDRRSRLPVSEMSAVV